MELTSNYRNYWLESSKKEKYIEAKIKAIDLIEESLLNLITQMINNGLLSIEEARAILKK